MDLWFEVMSKRDVLGGIEVALRYYDKDTGETMAERNAMFTYGTTPAQALAKAREIGLEIDQRTALWTAIPVGFKADVTP